MTARSMIALLATLLVWGCARETATIQAQRNVSEPHAEPHDHAPIAAPRITAGDLRLAIAAGSAIVVDIRTREQFGASHIEGAVNIPLEELAQRLSELPRAKMIAAYCT